MPNKRNGQTFNEMVEKMRSGGSPGFFKPSGSKTRYEDRTPKATHRHHAPRTSGPGRP